MSLQQVTTQIAVSEIINRPMDHITQLEKIFETHNELEILSLQQVTTQTACYVTNHKFAYASYRISGHSF